MNRDPLPILRAAAVAAPWLAALVALAFRRHLRAIAFAGSLASLLASILLLHAAAPRESLDEAIMVLFASLTLGATLVIPHRDVTRATVTGILFLLGATQLAYSAENLLVLLAGWLLSTLPFLFWGRSFRRPILALLLSTLVLALAIAAIALTGHSFEIGALKAANPGGLPVFFLLVAAVILRKGIFPAHSWVADAAEHGPAIPTALLLNGHFGAMLVAKLLVPLFPHTARDLFPVLSYLALATALFIALRALNENSPRRLLSSLALSQSACILAGLESRTAAGITGALVHWFVVTVSTMGLFAVLRLLEVRFGENLTASRYLGLVQHAPRLAVFFAVFGLALVGLPGTLSFCSQDLLIHGTLASHPQTGLLLPIATAMNAISFFRLFTRLFLGKRPTGFTAQADALPRERWALAAGVLFVVIGGLFPGAIVTQRSAEADAVRQALAPAPEHFLR